MRDSTIIYRSFWEAIKQLPAEQQAEAWNALFSYSLDFKQVEMSPLVNMVFTLIKPQLDANIKRYQVGIQNGNKGAEHGKKGGRPATTKPVENPQKTPKEPSTNPHHNPQQTLTKPPNDNDNDNHNENGNENENQNADLTLKNFSDETAETKTEGTAEAGKTGTTTQTTTPKPQTTSNLIHSVAELKTSLMQNKTDLDALKMAMRRMCGGGDDTHLMALVDTYTGLFRSKNGETGRYKDYYGYVYSCFTNNRKLPAVAGGQPNETQVYTPSKKYKDL